MSSEHSSYTDVEMGTERGFGYVFAVVFLVIGVWPLFFGGELRLWAIAVSLTVLIISLIFPSILRPLNILWFKFGLLLGKFVTPIIMGLLFLTTFVPVALFLRMSGKDNLRLKINKGTDSYWINRSGNDNSQSTFNNQF